MLSPLFNMLEFAPLLCQDIIIHASPQMMVYTRLICKRRLICFKGCELVGKVLGTVVSKMHVAGGLLERS